MQLLFSSKMYLEGRFRETNEDRERAGKTLHELTHSHSGHHCQAGSLWRQKQNASSSLEGCGDPNNWGIFSYFLEWLCREIDVKRNRQDPGCGFIIWPNSSLPLSPILSHHQYLHRHNFSPLSSHRLSFLLTIIFKSKNLEDHKITFPRKYIHKTKMIALC